MTDTFRKEYKPLTELQKAWMEDVKEKAEKLLISIDAGMDEGERSERARMIAIAKTNLEQAVMWAVKGITS